MVATDNPHFLLFIEPGIEEKLNEPVIDGWVDLMKFSFANAKKGCGGMRNAKLEFIEGGFYRGVHSTECGQDSKCYDYLLENGMVTNSLAKLYLIWYRNSITESELLKLEELKKFYSYDFELIFKGERKIDFNSLTREIDHKLQLDISTNSLIGKDIFGTKFIISKNYENNTPFYHVNSIEVTNEKLIKLIDSFWRKNGDF
ncbi:MAG: hypothetical protein KTR26_02985 [Flammeovirgaceae bacterium]|nr:hypothetical protein [Flammeovirgaceae bacterium]